MILRKALDDNDPTITIEIEQGDDIPEKGDIISINGEGILLGEFLHNENEIRTYRISERGLEDPRTKN